MFGFLCSYFFNDFVIDFGIVNILIYMCGKGIVFDELFVVLIC